MEEYLNSDDYYYGLSVILDYDYTIFVEGIEDTLFWYSILKKFTKNKKFYFERLFQKQAVLDKIKNENEGSTVFGCVDADYDYITNNEKLNIPQLFHTYTHSIENYFCVMETIEDFIKNNFNPNFRHNFKDFYQKYSEIVFPVLNKIVADNLMNIYCPNNQNNCFGSDLNFTSENDFLQNLETRIKNCKHTNNQVIPNSYNISNAYLFVRGKDFFNVCKKLIDYHLNLQKQNIIENIKSQLSGNEIENRIKELNNLHNSIYILFEKNYTNIFEHINKIIPLQLLKADIDNRLN